MSQRGRVTVYIRPRPATTKEVSSREAQGSLDLQNPNVGILNNTYGPFAHVWPSNVDNTGVAETAVMPLVETAASGRYAATFCYGHTGSGKTHTMMGYRGELGICAQAARRLFDVLGSNLKLSITITEVYNEKVYDLLGNRKQFWIKEARDGSAQIRGEVIVTNDAVRVTALTNKVVTNLDEVHQIIAEATAHRVSGNSTLHEQSSRSHAIVEFELVTDELLELREASLVAEAQLVPVGKDRDDDVINKRDGPALEELEAKFEIMHNEMVASHKRVEDCIQRGRSGGVGGTIVFIDLAGAEHGSGSNAGKQSGAEVKERQQINSSLLALKECIRSLHGKMAHVPFRNSKLTILLRRYLVADGCTVSMIANISGTASQANMSKNTLMYSQMVMDAGAAGVKKRR